MKKTHHAILMQEGIAELYDTSEETGVFYPESVLRMAAEMLRDAGVNIDPAIMNTPWHAPHAVLIADAINLAAKAIDEDFYLIKAQVFCAAALVPEVDSGWGEDGCFYLSAKGAGEVCAHDPFGDTGSLADQLGLTHDWPHPWSGVRRQALAFWALVSKDARNLLDRATRLKEWTDEAVWRIAHRTAQASTVHQ